jgi:hypothetical protein
VLVVDNGPELRGRELDRWAHVACPLRSGPP